MVKGRIKPVSTAFRQLKLSWKTHGVPCPIHEGDKVQVVTGNIDIDKQGKVIEVDEKKGTVTVQGLNMKPKKIPGVQRKIKWIEIPYPIPLSNVRLVDPITNTPTQIRMIKQDTNDWTRLTSESRSELPVPKVDPFKDKKDGALDTGADIVEQVSWLPSLSADPFPAKLWNQIHKLRRINLGNRAL